MQNHCFMLYGLIMGWPLSPNSKRSLSGFTISKPPLKFGAQQILAYSCFCAIHPQPQDGTESLFVPNSHRGTPDPWLEVPFPGMPGQCLVLESRTVHCGGGRSPSLGDAAPWRVVAFATMVHPPRDYEANAVAFRLP